MPELRVTKQMFFADIHTFRGYMGERSSWLDGKIERALGGLMLVYFKAVATGRHESTTDEDIELMDSTMLALLDEHERRLAYVVCNIFPAMEFPDAYVDL